MLINKLPQKKKLLVWNYQHYVSHAHLPPSWGGSASGLRGVFGLLHILGPRLEAVAGFSHIRARSFQRIKWKREMPLKTKLGTGTGSLLPTFHWPHQLSIWKRPTSVMLEKNASPKTTPSALQNAVNYSFLYNIHKGYLK